MYYHITNAACLKDYYVYLQFEDGTKGVINLESLAGKGEAFGPLRDKDFFCRMRIEPRFHTIEWPNGADLSPEVLYDKIKHADKPVVEY